MKNNDLPSTDLKHITFQITLSRIPIWLWLGSLVLILFFTPFSHFWSLVLVISGFLSLTNRISARQALLFSLVASIGGLSSKQSPSVLLLIFDQEAQAADTQSFSLEGIQKIDLTSFNGFVHVLVESGGEPQLMLKRHGGATVTIITQNQSIRIQAHKPFMGLNAGVDIELRIPKALDLKLETANGEITVDGAARSVNANTSNGIIRINNVGQSKLELNTSNSAIKVSEVQGQINASTSNAEIEIKNAHSTTLILESSNGSVTLEGVQLAQNTQNQIDTSNAAIIVRALSAPAGLEIRGETSNDGLDINLPGFMVSVEEDSFRARQDGFGMAKLHLGTSNDQIRVRP